MDIIKNEFRDFIIFFLKKGNVRICEDLCDEEGMKVFGTAFVHPSYSEENNYELYEFIGDSIINFSFKKYLREYDNKIVNVGVLTKIFHKII